MTTKICGETSWTHTNQTMKDQIASSQVRKPVDNNPEDNSHRADNKPSSNTDDNHLNKPPRKMPEIDNHPAEKNLKHEEMDEDNNNKNK